MTIRKTIKIDDCLRLDINQLRRGKCLQLNASGFNGVISWSSKSSSRVISIGYDFNTVDSNDMWLRLFYSYHCSQNILRNINYKIQIITTRPNYGGRRIWFVCPIIGKKSSVLYLMPENGVFSCRHAYKYQYASQSKSFIERKLDRLDYYKSEINCDEYFQRPKGMHHSTYNRKIQKIIELRDSISLHLKVNPSDYDFLYVPEQTSSSRP